MTRIKISAGILTALTIMGIISCLWINHRCSELIENVSDLQKMYLNNDEENAVITAEMLENEWVKFRKKASVLIRSEQIRDIENLFSGLKYLSCDDIYEAQKLTEEIICSLKILKSGETPSITNIL